MSGESRNKAENTPVDNDESRHLPLEVKWDAQDSSDRCHSERSWL
jgi:hypothetical protein